MKSFTNLSKFSCVVLGVLLLITPVLSKTSQQELSPQEITKLKAARQKTVEQHQFRHLLKFENSYKLPTKYISNTRQTARIKSIPNSALQKSKTKLFPKPLQNNQRFQHHWLGKSTLVGMNFLVNGRKSDTTEVGSEPTFTFDFPAGVDTASLFVIIDLDENGVWDSSVEPVVEAFKLQDNDIYDNNTSSGTYELVFNENFLLRDKEGSPLNRISHSFLYFLTSNSAADTTHILWVNMSSSFSVSGNVKDESGNPLEYIVVIAASEEYGEWIDITDNLGNYIINVPAESDYKVFSFDYLHTSGGLLPTPPFYNVYINGNMTLFDFTYAEGDAIIEGFVQDESGNPVSDIIIRIYGENLPFEFEDTTDASGHFSVTVMSGDYHVELEPESLIPTFMVPHRVHTSVLPSETASVNFTFYATDSQISGTVYVDDTPTPGVEVGAWNPVLGFTAAETDANGDYTLSVKSDPSERYWVGVIDRDYKRGYAQIENHSNISAGSSGIDIHLVSAPGGLYGAFINSETGDTIRGEIDIYITAEDINTGAQFSTGPDPETGLYELYLPDATYEIFAGGANYYSILLDTVEIAGSMIPFDVYLNPMVINSAVEGHVYDSESGNPIVNARIQIWNDYFYREASTDVSGFYHIDIPQGDYNISVEAPEYTPFYDSFSVDANETYTLDISLNPLMGTVFDGHVYDNENNPIQGAEILVRNRFERFSTRTDESGYFRIPLPGGEYEVDVVAEGYYPIVGDPLEIFDTPVTRDYYLNPFPIEGAVKGTVTDAETAEPIDSAHVFLKCVDTLLILHQFSNTDGTFDFEIPNGKYLLRVYHKDYVPFVSDTIEVNNDTTTVEVQLEQPDGIVSGMVFDTETGQGIPEAFVAVRDLTSGMTIPTITEYDGSYEIPLKNGYYEITAGAPGYFPSEPDTFQIIDNDVTINIGLTPVGIGDIIPPKILAVRDVPHDQGRWVRLTFLPGKYYGEPFSGWSIWRLRTFEPINQIGDPYSYNMDFVDFIPFHGDSVYSVVVPTLIDSNAYTSESGNYWSTFIVSGHLQWDMYQWFDSRPEAGYSVDNLIPHVPSNLSFSVGDNAITLTWDPVPDEDLAFYAVFKSTTSGNYPDNPAFLTAEGFITDTEVESGQTYYYTVVAVDANGNVSAPSDEIAATYTSILNEDAIPDKFALYNNFPNPFNPTTQIRFDMPEKGFVVLNIYDLSGKLIKTLVNENRNPGAYIVTWDGTSNKGQKVPSGIYIYRLNVKGKFSSTGKMVLMK